MMHGQHTKHDDRANLAFRWMFAPVSTIAVGFAATNLAVGWDSIAYFFMMLVVSVILFPVPVVLGILALKGGTDRKEKALLAVMVPVMALFTYFVSFGGSMWIQY